MRSQCGGGSIPVPGHIDLAWDANSVGDSVLYYNLYYGYSTGLYNGGRSPINVGTATTFRFRPDRLVTTFFVVTAVNAQGEGNDSNEVSKPY